MAYDPYSPQLNSLTGSVLEGPMIPLHWASFLQLEHHFTIHLRVDWPKRPSTSDTFNVFNGCNRKVNC